MKKVLALLCLISLLVFALGGCIGNETSQDQKETVRVAALKGPTGMGLAKLIEENESGESENHYEFTLASSADEILASIIQGEFDIAAVPTNVASILYNKTEGKIQMAAVNTLGVLYVLSTDCLLYTSRCV